MRGVKRNIAKERASLVGLDELERMVGQIIDDKSLTLHRLAVVIERRVEIGAPMAGGEAVIFVEAAGIGVIGPLGAVMPFAERGGGVPGGFEGVGNRLLVEVKTLATS